MKIVSSYQIKAALMWYYRYTRNIICGPEMHCADIMTYDGTWVHEIEIKVSKSDLWNGEARKEKHKSYTVGRFPWGTQGMPNKFSVCVPERLLDTAKEWVLTTNKKYGIIVCLDKEFVRDSIWIVKSARSLHTDKDRKMPYKLLRKLSSEVTMKYHDSYWRSTVAQETATTEGEERIGKCSA